MIKPLLGTVSTLVTIFVIPIIVYGLLSGILKMETPAGVSPLKFLLGVFVSKIGTAIFIAFVFYYAKDVFSDRWLVFTALLWVMFLLGEAGQLLGPNYTWKEALAGIISETIYLPVSVILLRAIFK